MKFFNIFKSNNHSPTNSTSDSKSISSSDSKSDSTSYPIFYNNINIQQQNKQHKQQHKQQQKQLLDNYCNYLENQILLLEQNIKIISTKQITHCNKQKLEVLVLEYKNIKLS